MSVSCGGEILRESAISYHLGCMCVDLGMRSLAECVNLAQLNLSNVPINDQVCIDSSLLDSAYFTRAKTMSLWLFIEIRP